MGLTVARGCGARRQSSPRRTETQTGRWPTSLAGVSGPTARLDSSSKEVRSRTSFVFMTRRAVGDRAERERRTLEAMLVALVAHQSGHLEREPLRVRAQRVEARASCPGVLLGGDPKGLYQASSIPLLAAAGSRAEASDTDQPTGARSRMIRRLLVRACSRSSARSISLGAGSVDQRLPTCRTSPDAASSRRRRSVFASFRAAALAILPVEYSPSGSSRSTRLTRSSRSRGRGSRMVEGASAVRDRPASGRFPTGRAGGASP